eukprot:COSAG01_NODE_54510_length_331_cov_1.560345_1_plen_59_part_10
MHPTDAKNERKKRLLAPLTSTPPRALGWGRATCRHRLQQLKSALGDFDKAIGILEALPD